MSTTEKIMSIALEYASAWSLVGSRFDNGHGMEYAEEARAALLKAVESIAADAARYQFLATSVKQVRYRSKGRKTWYAVINPLTNYEYDYEATLDVAIDTAMKETP